MVVTTELNLYYIGKTYLTVTLLTPASGSKKKNNIFATTVVQLIIIIFV